MLNKLNTDVTVGLNLTFSKRELFPKLANITDDAVMT